MIGGQGDTGHAISSASTLAVVTWLITLQERAESTMGIRTFNF
jgi:hypothetical protein